MAGIDVTTLQRLGIAGHFHDVLHHRTTSWFRHGREVRRDQLPSPAYGISRYTLDARLADSFRALGGELTLGQRAKLKQSEPGLIWAAGRRRAQGGWLGIKCHCRGFPLQADLEVHLGSLGYAGASAVEDGWINVCGLFRVRSDLKCRKEDALLRYAEASGMESLADRLRSAPKREGSFTATAGMTFSRLWQLPDTPVIGDALSVIPPFTGNGMTMAFESAFLALNPLVKYAAGKAVLDRLRGRDQPPSASPLPLQACNRSDSTSMDLYLIRTGAPLLHDQASGFTISDIFSHASLSK